MRDWIKISIIISNACPGIRIQVYGLKLIEVKVGVIRTRATATRSTRSYRWTRRINLLQGPSCKDSSTMLWLTWRLIVIHHEFLLLITLSIYKQFIDSVSIVI